MIRPKVFLVTLLAGFTGVAMMSYVSRHAGPTSTARTKVGLGRATSSTNAAKVPRTHEVSMQKDSPASKRTGERHAPEKTTDEAVENIVRAKVELLQELSRKSDHASMEAILAEVKSPYPEVRGDAIEAIIQFGSRNAIPALKELAGQTEDPREKIAILEAVEFLQLPSLDELRANLNSNRSQRLKEPAAP